jgi:hypothetical protein
MKGRISLIKIQSTIPIAKDFELAQRVAAIERENHLDGGLIIPHNPSSLSTNKYCQQHNIDITKITITTLEEMRQFYTFLREGVYAQTEETVHPLLRDSIKDITRTAKFNLYTFS